MAIRIVVADDHRLFRQGLCTLLEEVTGIEVVGEAQNGEEVVLKVRDLCPDIVLMDLEMPDINGVVATRLISEQLPQVKVLVLSAHEDDEQVYAAMKAGARGYMVKRIDADELINILYATQRGERFFSPYLANLALQEATPSPASQDEVRASDLTRQEQQVLKRVVEGLSNDAIADALCVSKETVKAHMKRIFDKLQVDNRTQAAVSALKRKLMG